MLTRERQRADEVIKRYIEKLEKLAMDSIVQL